MGGMYSWVAAVILVGHAAAYTSPSMARLNGRTPSVRMGPEDNGKKSFKLSGVVKSTALHVKSERQKQRVAIHNAIIRHKARYNELRVEGYPEPNVIDVYVHAAGSDKFKYVESRVPAMGLAASMGRRCRSCYRGGSRSSTQSYCSRTSWGGPRSSRFGARR